MTNKTFDAALELANQHWQHELLSSLEVGIVVLDKDFTVEVWNQFMENHSNLLPSQICGSSIFQHFKEINEEWLRMKIAPVYDLSSPVFLIWEQRPYLFKFGVNRPITSSATVMYQNVTMFPITSVTGEVDRVCMMVYDVTDQATSKLQVQHLNSELKMTSRMDGLTGLYNRRYWQDRFDQSYQLAKRNESPITALMLDIDHFKSVNDTYGHQAGDKVIQALAKVIKENLRQTDLAGRYGGEEFALILPDTPSDGGLYVAERIRKLSMKQSVEHEGKQITFTISVGVAQLSIENTTPMQWLEKADQALYQAKESGRNCVVEH